MSVEENKIDIKVVTIGNGFVGKTCLCEVFSKGKFPDEYEPTIYETMSREIQVGDKKVKLTLEDTAGQEGYEQMRHVANAIEAFIEACLLLSYQRLPKDKVTCNFFGTRQNRLWPPSMISTMLQLLGL